MGSTGKPNNRRAGADFRSNNRTVSNGARDNAGRVVRDPDNGVRRADPGALGHAAKGLTLDHAPLHVHLEVDGAGRGARG